MEDKKKYIFVFSNKYFKNYFNKKDKKKIEDSLDEKNNKCDPDNPTGTQFIE